MQLYSCPAISDAFAFACCDHVDVYSFTQYADPSQTAVRLSLASQGLSRARWMHIIAALTCWLMPSGNATGQLGA